MTRRRRGHQAASTREPAQPPAGRAKAVPKSVRIGQRGINVIERIVEDVGHLWTPTRPASDAGTDGFIELCDHEERSTGQVVQVQSKATLGAFRNETATSSEFLCDERDLTRWLEGNAPFILIVSRPPDEAYWIPVKSYFSDPAVRTKRLVVFDKVAHAFNKEAAQAASPMMSAVLFFAGSWIPPCCTSARTPNGDSNPPLRRNASPPCAMLWPTSWTPCPS